MTIRFLQLHWLASYPGTLLNRDDAGLGKRLPFGGVTRGRVSSQSLKRHWRLAGSDRLEKAGSNPWALQNLDTPMGVRTKLAVEEKVMPRAMERQTAPDAVREAVEAALLQGLHGKDATDPRKRPGTVLRGTGARIPRRHGRHGTCRERRGESGQESGRPPEGQTRESARSQERLRARRGTLRAHDHLRSRSQYRRGHPRRHAITVHPMERELDYMTAVDDLVRREDEEHQGAAGVFDMELTSGLYYGYVVVDIGLLIANLARDEEIAAKVVEHLVHLVAQVSPGAKKGSTAPYAWAELMLIEAGTRQPRTLANAFRDPIRLPTNRLLGTAVERMGVHLTRLDEAYGGDEIRRQLAVDADAALPEIERKSIDELAQWSADIIRDAQGLSA